MKEFNFRKKLKFAPEYDLGFFPMSVGIREYQKAVVKEKSAAVIIALERSGGLVSIYKTDVFAQSHEEDNNIYIERILKTLLWLKGGFHIYFSGPSYIYDYIKDEYRPGGAREFDSSFMIKIYGENFSIELVTPDKIPLEKEEPKPIGGHLDGCRIGFDAGGSDRKVSAVVNGETIFSEEVIWHPKLSADPRYQYDGIMNSMKTAASKMDRVDAIGISAAGIYINNEVKAASLFCKVPEDRFESEVKRIFYDISKEMGSVPFEVVNDGDVTALAGALSLEKNGILGIAMGTSEAGGYVDQNGLVTGWLNELAFVPVDYSRDAMLDEWAGDTGCGVKYFSQDGIIKLAENSGIIFKNELSPAEKLKVVQGMMDNNDERAYIIYKNLGIYMGYSLAYYSDFYDINHVLLMGRVTSGEGGDVIVEFANKVLEAEFPELAEKFTVSMPNEKARRVGQSVAAASLPKISGA